MNDMNALSRSQRAKDHIIVEETRDEQRPALDEGKHTGIYFIGFLIVVLVAFSAVAMSLSLKNLSRLESTETAFASTDSEILLWLKKNDETSAALLEILKNQEDEIQALAALVSDSNTEELARIGKLNGQIKKVKTAMKEKEEELADMMFAHNSLKTSIQDSIYDLKAADRLIEKKNILLKDQVEKIVETNSYLYNMN